MLFVSPTAPFSSLAAIRYPFKTGADCAELGIESLIAAVQMVNAADFGGVVSH